MPSDGRKRVAEPHASRSLSVGLGRLALQPRFSEDDLVRFHFLARWGRGGPKPPAQFPRGSSPSQPPLVVALTNRAVDGRRPLGASPSNDSHLNRDVGVTKRLSVLRNSRRPRDTRAFTAVTDSPIMWALSLRECSSRSQIWIAVRTPGVSRLMAKKRNRSVSLCAHLRSGLALGSGIWRVASAASLLAVDTSTHTALARRLLKHMMASLIAIRVNQVENDDRSSNLCRWPNAFWKLCWTTSSASSRLRVTRCAIRRILPWWRLTRTSKAPMLPFLAAATSAESSGLSRMPSGTSASSFSLILSKMSASMFLNLFL